MKKILILLLASAGLLIASCAVHKDTSSPPPQKKDTVVKRVRVGGIETRLLLHPVDNITVAGKDTFFFLHDYPNGYFDFVDNQSLYDSIKNFLPERINKQSAEVSSVDMIAMSANPFASFTKQTVQKIATAQGLEFGKINDYRLASASNAQQEIDSLKSIRLLLNMLQGKNDSNKNVAGRAGVSGAQSILRKHPIKSILKGAGDKQNLYTFYDFAGGWLYVTEDSTIYEKFSAALPFAPKNNIILVQGAAIDPLVSLDQESLKKMEEEKGLQINGDGDATKNANTLTSARITGFLIVEDYPDVIKNLQKKLKEQPVNNSRVPDVTTKPPARQPSPVNKPAQASPQTTLPKKLDPNRPFDPNEKPGRP
jgi:hypothetical protein